MEPIEALTEAERQTILNYIYNVGDGSLPQDRLDLFLSSWNTGKAQLFQLFGNKLRLERHIVYDTPKKDITNKVDDIVRKYTASFITPMKNDIYNYVSAEDRVGAFETKYYYLFQAAALVDNEYPACAWYPNSLDIRTPGGANRIRLSAGAKPMRLIGKLARAFGYKDIYEQFRIEVSQALNVAHLEGNLCLSIHPMDYMTMSDNDCDWHSCMSWSNDGEYKVGTLEMLGSDYCVVAYLASEKPYRFDEANSWYNKKWRQLLFVHPAFIVGNRHYPFEVPDVEKIAMDWLKELAEAANFSKYSNERVELVNGKTCDDVASQPFFLSLQMKEMYNDLSRNYYYLAENFEDYLAAGRELTVDLSGDARCINCGCVIDYVPDPRYLLCDSCIEGFECSCCGEFVAGNPEYTNSEGQQFCYYCIEDSDYIVTCDICDEYYTDGNIYEIDINAPDGETLSTVCACHSCKNSKEITRLFGDFTTSRSFNAANVTEEGHLVLGDRYKDFDEEELAEYLVFEEDHQEEE